jgi:hypothetical protein
MMARFPEINGYLFAADDIRVDARRLSRMRSFETIAE